jgi:hypothetical protein
MSLQRAVQIMSQLFEERCEKNSAMYTAPGDRRVAYRKADITSATEPVTVYHTACVPDVSIEAFSILVHQHAYVSQEVIVAAFILMARYERATQIPITAHMMHRVFVASVHIAAKVHVDFFVSNERFAQVVGVTLQEMNRLEARFIKDLEWHVLVSKAEYLTAVREPHHVFGAILPSYTCEEPRADGASNSSFAGITAMPSVDLSRPPSCGDADDYALHETAVSCSASSYTGTPC